MTETSGPKGQTSTIDDEIKAAQEQIAMAKNLQQTASENLERLQQQKAYEQEMEYWDTCLPITRQLMSFVGHYCSMNGQDFLNNRYTFRYIPGKEDHRVSVEELNRKLLDVVSSGQLDGNKIYSNAHDLISDVMPFIKMGSNNSSQKVLWDWSMESDTSATEIILKSLDWNGSDWQKPKNPFPIRHIRYNGCNFKPGFSQRSLTAYLQKLAADYPNAGFRSVPELEQLSLAIRFQTISDNDLLQEIQRRGLSMPLDTSVLAILQRMKDDSHLLSKHVRKLSNSSQ